MRALYYKLIGDPQPRWVWHLRTRALGQEDTADIIFAGPELRRIPSPFAAKRYGRILMDMVRSGSKDSRHLAWRWLQWDRESPKEAGVPSFPLP